MKKFFTALTVLFIVLAFVGCEYVNIPTNVTLPSDITIPSSTEIATSNTTGDLTTEITSEPITTIINDEIYLQLNAGQDTVEINSEWTDAGALFVLNDETYEMTTEDMVDVSILDLYQIDYTYIYEETEYTITRYVIVVDQTAPEIKLNLGVDTIKVGETWTDAGVTITDNSGEEITAVMTEEVDNTTIGTYTITYIATDSSGNGATIFRYVTVVE